MAKKIIAACLLLAVAVGCVFVIFSFSSDNKNASIKKTIWGKSIVMQIGETFHINQKETDFVLDNIRKISHVIEYFAFGTAAAVILIFLKKRSIQGVINITTIGMLTAVADETIQIYSHRSSLLTDVWIDTGGFLLGIGFCFAIWWLFNKAKKHIKGKRGVHFANKAKRKA